MTRLACLATALVACSLMTGCSSDYSISFRFLTSAPPEVIIDSNEIRIPEGLAVGIEALAIEDGDLTDAYVEFVPVRPGIVGIDYGLHDRTFVIYGMSVGATSVDYYFDAELVGNLPAEVVPQDPTQ